MLNAYAKDVGHNCPVPSDIKVNANYDTTCHYDWTSYMDSQAKIPVVVFYTITAEKVRKKNVQRPNASDFDPDPNYPAKSQAKASDYINSGYDKGHLYSNNDANYSKASARSSFYMTNIAPQTHSLNAGPWLKFENKGQELATSYGSVNVYAISVYSKKSKKIKSGIVIPDSYIKILCIPKECHIIHFPNDNSKRFTSINASTLKELTNNLVELK